MTNYKPEAVDRVARAIYEAGGASVRDYDLASSTVKFISRGQATAAIDALLDGVELEWEDSYAQFQIGANFSGYYDITKEDLGLVAVSLGVHCHEFGDTVVWRGPEGEAKAAALSHHRDQIARALGVR